MSVLDWLFVGLLSCAILFSVVGLFSLVGSIKFRQKIKQLKRKKPKLKKRQKRWKKEVHLQQKKKKRWQRNGIILLLFACLSTGGGIYARYYQQTNLNTADSEIIVQSYFLIGEVEKELAAIQQGADVSKTQGKLREMFSLLISYTTRQPSTGLSVEGQQLLRRYYTRMKEWGMNLDNQTSEQLSDPKKIEEYLSDIKQIHKEQSTVFKTFGINESALKQKK